MSASEIAACVDVEKIRSTLRREMGGLADIPDDREFKMTVEELRGWAEMLGVLALLAEAVQKETSDGA